VTALTDDREALQRDLFDASLALLRSQNTRDALLHANPDDAFPDAAWRAVVDAGWGLTLLDEARGGLGLGVSEAAAIFRAVGRGPCRGPLHDLVVALPLLANAANAATRQRLLDGVHGRALVVVAEPLDPPYGGGARAVSWRDGQLAGTIDLVPFAANAERFVVVANDGTDPLMVVVEASSVSRERTVSHDPCVDRGRVVLDGASVRQEDIVVAGAAAERVRDRIRSTVRLMVAAELAGATAAMTDMSVEYAKVREQFGRPIAGFQAVRHMLARMTQRTVSLANLVDASVADVDRDAGLLHESAAVAKAYATSTGRSVAEEALQVHGGIGFTAEYPLHLYMRRALTLEGVTGESSAVTLDLGRSALA
jgi:alkylation response protein AidB-like acyl-CoA dehydrogenase